METTSETTTTAKPTVAEMGIEEGDIFVCSWGYDQTNIDFYQVTKTTKRSITVCRIAQELVRNGDDDGHRDGHDHVVPVKDQFLIGRDGGPRVKFPRMWSGEPTFDPASYSVARKWDGQPEYQTASGWGH